MQKESHQQKNAVSGIQSCYGWLVLEEGNDFLIEDLAKDVVAVFMSKSFKFVSGIEVEQSVVDVQKVFGQIMWNIIVLKQIMEVKSIRNAVVESFDVLEFREIVTSGL